MKCFQVKSFKSQIGFADFKWYSALLDSFGNWGSSVYSVSSRRILDRKQDSQGLKRMYNSKE